MIPHELERGPPRALSKDDNLYGLNLRESCPSPELQDYHSCIPSKRSFKDFDHEPPLIVEGSFWKREFRLPGTDDLIAAKSHPRGEPKAVLPSDNATVDQVRQFLFTILTVRSWEIASTYPRAVRATINQWYGLGRRLRENYEQRDGLDDLCPETSPPPNGTAYPYHLRKRIATCVRSEIEKEIKALDLTGSQPAQQTWRLAPATDAVRIRLMDKPNYTHSLQTPLSPPPVIPTACAPSQENFLVTAPPSTSCSFSQVVVLPYDPFYSPSSGLTDDDNEGPTHTAAKVPLDRLISTLTPPIGNSGARLQTLEEAYPCFSETYPQYTPNRSSFDINPCRRSTSPSPPPYTQNTASQLCYPERTRTPSPPSQENPFLENFFPDSSSHHRASILEVFRPDPSPQDTPLPDNPSLGPDTRGIDTTSIGLPYENTRPGRAPTVGETLRDAPPFSNGVPVQLPRRFTHSLRRGTGRFLSSIGLRGKSGKGKSKEKVQKPREGGHCELGFQSQPSDRQTPECGDGAADTNPLLETRQSEQERSSGYQADEEALVRMESPETLDSRATPSEPSSRHEGGDIISVDRGHTASSLSNVVKKNLNRALHLGKRKRE